MLYIKEIISSFKIHIAVWKVLAVLLLIGLSCIFCLKYYINSSIEKEYIKNLSNVMFKMLEAKHVNQFLIYRFGNTSKRYFIYNYSSYLYNNNTKEYDSLDEGFYNETKEYYDNYKIVKINKVFNLKYQQYKVVFSSNNAKFVICVINHYNSYIFLLKNHFEDKTNQLFYDCSSFKKKI